MWRKRIAGHSRRGPRAALRPGRGIVALLAGMAASTAVVAADGLGAARTAPPKVVEVGDNYYDPTQVRIRRERRVSWRWTAGFQAHNVRLVKAPEGVRKSRFRSQNAGSPTPPFYRFTRRFRRPGRYHFVCTLHRLQMRMEVRVRRPRGAAG